MRRIVFYLLAGLFIVPIESFIFGQFDFAKPDISLLVVFFVGLFFGEGEGLLVGGFLGIILDIFYGGVLGINFFSKVLVGYLSGLIGSNFQNINLPFSLSSIFLVSVVDLITSFTLLFLFYENIIFDNLLKEVILPTAFYTTLTGGIVASVLSAKGYRAGEN